MNTTVQRSIGFLFFLLFMLFSTCPAMALTLTEAQKLLASDGEIGDLFGISVAVDGDVAVIGAKWDDDIVNDRNSGSAYVFTYDDVSGLLTEQAKLTASDGARSDDFGFSVAIDGDTIVIGAPFDDDMGGNSGSAYVFTYDDVSGLWTEQAKLTASDGAGADTFGWSVAVNGDTAVIGALGDDGIDDSKSNSGSAYVFTRSNSNWTEQAKLTDSDGAMINDQFGISVAVDGDIAVIGAYGDDDSGEDSGSAFVFTYDDVNGEWSQTAKLTAEDGAAGDYFGYSVAVDGDTAVIGAYWDDLEAGSAYVFTRNGSTWTEQAKLVASDGAEGDYLGISVAVDGDTAVIGAYYDDDSGSNSGSVYVFTRNGSTWTEQAKLVASDGAESDYLGISVAVDGDTAVIGAYGDDDNDRTSGSAYLFYIPIDEDGDGVLDEYDDCPQTAPGAVVDGYGCSGAQNVDITCPCDGEWKNHGKYVKCVVHAAKDQVVNGLITKTEKGAIVSERAKSDCGKKKAKRGSGKKKTKRGRGKKR